MKIRKQTALNTTIKQRLDAYSKQANSYQQLRQTTTQRKSKTWLKTSLTALAPLAAQVLIMPMANAQCGVGIVDDNNPTFNTANCARRLLIDLDGDGSNDVGIGFLTSASFIYGTFINPNSMASIATAGTAGFQVLVDAVTAGVPANGLNFQVADGNNLFLMSASGTLGEFATPVGGSTTGYITLEIEGNYAFIEVTITRPTANDRCISIGDFGVESAGNTNTVEVGVCSTLPVELSKFEALTTPSAIVLEWETLSELQNMGFELQRSTDAQNFRKIAWVDGEGTSNMVQRYQYKDEKVIVNQLYYYRLVQFDEDGSFESSEIITASIKNESALQVSDFYPNPTQEWTQLEVYTQNGSLAYIQLFDKAGRVLQQIEQEISKGINQVRLDLSDLPEGIYFAKIDVDGERIYRKVSLVR